jgi:hypothetical protein
MYRFQYHRHTRRCRRQGDLRGGRFSRRTFVLQGTTNLANPPKIWPRIATSWFDASGGINFTNFFNSNLPAQFLQIETQ